MRVYEDFLDTLDSAQTSADKASLTIEQMSQEELNERFNFRLDVVYDTTVRRNIPTLPAFIDSVLFLIDHCTIIDEYADVTERVEKDIPRNGDNTLLALYMRIDRTRVNTYMFYQKFLIPYSVIFCTYMSSQTSIFTDVDRDGSNTGQWRGGVYQSYRDAEELAEIVKGNKTNDGNLCYPQFYIYAYIFEFITGEHINTNANARDCDVKQVAYDFLFHVMFNKSWRNRFVWQTEYKKKYGLVSIPVSFSLTIRNKTRNYEYTIKAADYVEMAVKLQLVSILLDFPACSNKSFEKLPVCNREFFQRMIFSNDSVHNKMGTLIRGTLMKTLMAWDEYEICHNPSKFLERFQKAMETTESYMLKRNNPFLWFAENA